MITRDGSATIMRRARYSIVGLLGIGLAWNCGGDSRSGSMPLVRDSAGIEIVETGSGARGETEAWRVPSEPALDIGVLEGPPEHQLFQVRDARRLRDGRIVVVNMGTSELRFFGAHGEYLASAGRRGSGPGEFEQVAWVRPYPGDSLLAYDFRTFRASVLDRDGKFGRSFRVSPMGDGTFVVALGAFADGTLLAKTMLAFSGGLQDGLQQRDEIVHTHDGSGNLLDSIGTFPGPQLFVQSVRSGENMMMFTATLPFGRRPQLALLREAICWGDGDRYEIACYDRHGTLQRLIRRDVPARRVTTADRDAYTRRQMENADDNRLPAIRRRLAEVPFPETMPVYDAFLSDAGDNFWVREFDPEPEMPRTWHVFDPGGRLLGAVTTPAGLGVTQVGEDFVLGVWRDEADVEHVRLYPLVKE